MKDYNKFTNDEMEIKIWEYIDGLSTDSERSKIEKLISEQYHWKVKYQHLLEIHQLVCNTELEEPSMRFTRNVMEELASFQIAPAVKNYINNKIIWGIGLFFLTFIIGFLVYGFFQINWSEGSDTIGGIDLTKVNYSVMFNNTYMNIFMMINVVLGLILIDRVLSIKKKKYLQNA